MAKRIGAFVRYAAVLGSVAVLAFQGKRLLAAANALASAGIGAI